MKQALYFKILQRRNRYRNSSHVTELPLGLIYTQTEYDEAQSYLRQLDQLQIQYTYPGHEFYPPAFLHMKEPPLFLEYMGRPVWLDNEMISIVGSREITDLTESWMKFHLSEFLNQNPQRVGIVSGGARGVDQTSHLIAIKNKKPTVFVLPSGLLDLYPKNLAQFRDDYLSASDVCFLTEFEIHQKIHKSHFYFRNRLIAALGKMTFVTQSSLKSGSLLTVHHSLEIGKPVLTVPSHPEMHGHAGNIKLMQEGAFMVSSYHDLLDFWVAESGYI
ncbi:MAG: DNA-processing protein DprA [Pseudobdellovibrio sp.]